MPRRAGWEALTRSQESLAPAVESMCWSRCWSYFAFSLLTVFIIRLEIMEVIGEYVSAEIKRESLTLLGESFFFLIVLQIQFNGPFLRTVTMQINQVMTLAICVSPCSFITSDCLVTIWHQYIGACIQIQRRRVTPSH